MVNETEKTCIIVGASPNDNKIEVLENSFVIAADGGYAQLIDQGIEADLVVGDFDSLGCVPQHKYVIRHPSEKDDTDMMLAARMGLERGFKKFMIYGGLGGRWDHSYANVQLLCFLAIHGAQGILVEKENRMSAIYNDSMSFNETYRGIISVFAASTSAKGVDLKGLKYELNNATLSNCVPLGTSNEFIGKPATISVDEGILVIMWHENLQ